ncbi:MAG TPA: hypothetical protein VFN95_12530, partial [Flavitalea sp.]|nr:hypothetical protein [Flavitalea sp.]
MNRIFYYLKRFFLSAIFLTIGVIVFSQLNGDYRSKQNGFWHDAASWERFNGTSWVNAPTAPTSSDGQISVLNGHTITTSSVGGDITADQVTVNAGGILTLNSTLNLADGAGDDLTVNGTMDFNGSLNGPGNIVISAAGAINFPALFDVFLGAPLTNNGNMNWQGNGRIWAMSNMTITNNGTFTITSNSSTFDNAGFQSSFVNNGNITKNSGGQTDFRNTNFTNAGIINLNAGTLQNFCAFSNTGTLNFNGGTFSNSLGGITSFAFNAGSAISGTGSFINSASMTLNVNVVFPATILFNTGGHTSVINGTGNLTINNDFTMQGLVDGSGALIINGNVVWNSGTLGRAFTVDAGRTMTITTTNIKIVAAAIINNGTINWQDGHISFSSPTTVTNNNLFIINSNSNLAENGPLLGSLINNGVITKSSVGLTVIALTNVTNNDNAIVKGIGTINLSFPAVFNNNGIIEPGLSPGILTINSNNSQPFSSTSTLSIEIAGNGGAGQQTGHDQLQRAGDLTLIGNLTVIETGTVPDGDYTIISLTSGAISGTFSSANLPANYSVIYNSNNVVVRKGTICPPSVTINASPGNTVCAGTNITFTATPTNGGTPSYQWKLNGNNVGTNSNTYSNSALANGDIVTVVMTSSLGCANPNTATSNGITMAVTPAIVPSVGISSDPGNTICSGTNVTFTATPTNGGTPSYQWKLNGNNVGTNSNTYQNTSLANGDIVTVVMTSSIACASPNPVTSNSIVMSVSSAVVPSVTIAATPGNTICTGTNVTFIATPINGGTPSYQWKLNGNNVGTNSNTYSGNTLTNGDIVTVVMTSSQACASPATATSNGITMAVNENVTPSVSIAASPGSTICSGTNVTFTATPTNGGTPSYQWKLNGNNAGTNSNTYQNASLVNGDVVTVVMTSSLVCASPTTATSNALTMTVNPALIPSVSIAANPGSTICTGTNVTFTATPTNGGSPAYQWKLNGNNVGTNSNTYQNSTLVNGDVVTLVMTSSLACASPAAVTSNAITMVVSGNVSPSVSIVANPGSTICTGTNVTFTATPTNGGTPSYQWKLNGNNVGTNSNTYQNASLANGDVVTVVVTSSLACASPATATSNAIGMTVSGNVTPLVNIGVSPGN